MQTPCQDPPPISPVNLCLEGKSKSTPAFVYPVSELGAKHETFKPKRDPSRKVHIHRAGQRPGGADDNEAEAPSAKAKKGESRAALERARAQAEGGN